MQFWEWLRKQLLLFVFLFFFPKIVMEQPEKVCYNVILVSKNKERPWRKERFLYELRTRK